jgi:hypothetical protein
VTEVDLQSAAQEHLWLHFTRMDGYRDAEVPMIVCSDGCYLEDAGTRRSRDDDRRGRMARFSERLPHIARSGDSKA